MSIGICRDILALCRACRTYVQTGSANYTIEVMLTEWGGKQIVYYFI